MRPEEKPYVVPVRELPARRTFEVPAAFVAEALAGMAVRDALETVPPGDGGTLTADLYGEGEHVFLAGDMHGALHVACSRCVEPVRIAIDDKLRVTFVPHAELPSDDGEAAGEDGAEVGEGDLDLFGYDGEHVDVEPLLREQFVLAVPYAPLCQEDCKGLCPQCGINKNSGTCSCEKPIDPRLSALKGLKLPS